MNKHLICRPTAVPELVAEPVEALPMGRREGRQVKQWVGISLELKADSKG